MMKGPVLLPANIEKPDKACLLFKGKNIFLICQYIVTASLFLQTGAPTTRPVSSACLHRPSRRPHHAGIGRWCGAWRRPRCSPRGRPSIRPRSGIFNGWILNIQHEKDRTLLGKNDVQHYKILCTLTFYLDSTYTLQYQSKQYIYNQNKGTYIQARKYVCAKKSAYNWNMILVVPLAFPSACTDCQSACPGVRANKPQLHSISYKSFNKGKTKSRRKVGLRAIWIKHNKALNLGARFKCHKQMFIILQNSSSRDCLITLNQTTLKTWVMSKSLKPIPPSLGFKPRLAQIEMPMQMSAAGWKSRWWKWRWKGRSEQSANTSPEGRQGLDQWLI